MSTRNAASCPGRCVAQARTALFVAFILAPTITARAEGPTLTGDIQLGVGLPVAGHLGPRGYYDDHARFGLTAYGDVGVALSDRFSLELLVGLGYLFELDAQNDDFGNVVATATVGPKVRFLDTRQLWASLHVGYVRLDGHQGGFDTALGYDLGLGETRDLSVFLRYALTVRGTATLERDQHFDALLMAGVGMRFGRIGVASADPATEPEPIVEPAPEPIVDTAPVEPAPVEEPEPEPAAEPVAPIAPAAEPTEDEDDAPYVDVDRAVIGTHAPYIVRFAYDDDTIRGPGLSALRKVARWLRAHPEARRLRIVGHTDPRGDEQHNARLSSNRARAVREWLIREGFSARRFEIVGVGATEPLVADPQSERDQGRNRRVELIVIDAE